MLKVAEAVRETVAMSILTEIQDPRVKNVTVTYVEVSGDLRLAKVKVSVMGTPAQQALCIKGLQSCAGFLQTKIAKRIKSRYVPRIEFILDPGVKQSIAVSQLLSEILPHPEKPEEASDSDEWEDEEFEEDSDESDDESDGTAEISDEVGKKNDGNDESK